MSDQELFGNEGEGNQPTPTPPADTNTPYDLLGSIKNADGTQKYKTQEDVVKGHDNAQSHIKTLEAEMLSLKAVNEAQSEKISTQSTVDQLLKDALENKAPSAEETPPTNGLTAQEVTKLMEVREQQNAVKTKATLNRDAVKGKLVEMYSDKASEKFGEIAEKNNMTIQELTDMTETNPSVVLNLFSGADNSPAEQSSPTNYSLPTGGNPPPSSVDQPKLLTGFVPSGAIKSAMSDITTEIKNKYGVT